MKTNALSFPSRSIVLGGFLLLSSHLSAQAWLDAIEGVGTVRVVDSQTWTRIPQIPAQPVFSTIRSNYDERVLKHWAEVFEVEGKIERIPKAMSEAPGWWVRQMSDAKNELKWRCVLFSEASGMLAYYSGDDGFRYDKKERKFLIQNVPERQVAIDIAVNLFRRLGLDTARLKTNNKGEYEVTQRINTVKFFSRDEMKHKTIIKQRTIQFPMAIGDGKLLGSRDTGFVSVTFVTDGKVSAVECNLFNIVVTNRPSRPDGRRVWAKGTEPFKIPSEAEAEIVYPVPDPMKIPETLFPFCKVSIVQAGSTNRDCFYKPAW